jgi:hypothetical protein
VPSTSLRRPGRAATNVSERPPVVPFAVVFGLLSAAEALYLAWLSGWPHPTLDWFVIAPVVLAVAAVAGAALVLRGRARGWLVSVLAAGLLLVAVLTVVALLAAVGDWRDMWPATLLLIGPLGSLVLNARRPVRDWTTRGSAVRPPGGRRGAGGSR